MVDSKEDNSIEDREIDDDDENLEIDENISDEEQEQEEEEGDLLIQQNDREENVLKFLQAVDLQVLGACRADERLIPLLKTNVPNCAAEHRLLSNLIQHFEAQEIGMLARCLCMPLVSIRVGRIIKQGNLLCPTTVRGNLNLTLLPSSYLRISFTGDDGFSERLATLGSNCKTSSVMIEEIPADSSGRSFLLKLPSSQVYFWCSEKSKLLGNELLAKMKDVLERKPSLAELTGINELRLDCFAIHFREYLLGTTVNNSQTSQLISVTSLDIASKTSEMDSSFQNSSSLSFPQQNSSEVSNTRSLSFSEDFSFALGSTAGVVNIRNKPSDGSIPTFSSVELCRNIGSPSSLNQLIQGLPSSRNPTGDSNSFSLYCPCPPCTSTLQYAEVPPNVNNSFIDSFVLPPLSSLLSANRLLNSVGTLNSPHNLIDVTSLDLSAFLSEPVGQVPLSISLASMSSSQQITTFTPLTCDPIVHIPAIGICSSGQGYLVSAGHAVPTTIPLHPDTANHLVADSESMVEKGARETLQLLLGSAQTNPWSRDVSPAVLTSTADIYEHGSRPCQCSETTDDASFASGIRAICDIMTCHSGGGGCIDSSDQAECSGGLNGSHSDDVNNDAVG
ncbi:flocculation protein [Thalictrum thalictroides]|uniref:Flocculation protein n=1 Tax=Thalictrum thalictroides TaxID=46969 RepID=A0A7J6XGF0_THATH|nr:flocculation protein [Thalictrum thalictroides]